MKVSLIKDNKLLNYKLPARVDGNFWLNELDANGIEKNIINIESKNGSWVLVSNSDYFVSKNSAKVPSVVLNERSIITLNHAYSYNSLYLFTYPTFEANYKYYTCTNEIAVGITIGRNPKSTIIYESSLVDPDDLIIKKENGVASITCQSAKNIVFVNDIAVNHKATLYYGDVIFFMGLRILYFNINGEDVLGVNDNYINVKTHLNQYKLSKSEKTKIEESSEDKDIELYTQDDYFYKKPRFIYNVSPFEISVDQPPGKQEAEDMPAILTVGPMLTMSLTSVMTLYTTFSNINNGTTTIKDSMPQLVMSGAMMLSFFLWPAVISAFNKRLRKKREKNRINKYTEYINGIENKLNEQKKIQEDIMKKKYLSIKECEQVILKKEDRLWERRVFDNDFLTVSLGIGSLPMSATIDLPEEHFSMIEDILIDKMNELKTYDLRLENVPIPFSFRENYISAIVGKYEYQKKMMQNVLLQLIGFHGYESLKIAVFTSRDKANNWDYIRTVPHIWSNDKSMRYFASSEKEYKEVTYFLDKIYNEREENLKNDSGESEFSTLYLLVVDTYTAVRNLDLITKIINSKNYLGFSILLLNDKISTLPDQCQIFIELDEAQSKISKNIAGGNTQTFNIDMSYLDINRCVSTLSNTPLELRDEGAGAIPKKVGFLEMYGVGKVEQFNVKNRWEENTPIMSMAAMVGIGNNGEKISLDLHEKYHGPHGLIAGMTGSGKSEFIITYILSLAINYHPDEVQFILIDYKGGGLAGAFENQTVGYKLPHLVGVITNLDKTEINRSLASIESELKRRQALFNKARTLSEESSIDIYKYQEMYRSGKLEEPVSHLIIIADEFAELKTQQPEFMDQLISTARIGRSLGVHLILATQKPSGVVDSQIWSNTRFRVCLRVQEKSDSTEVIKRPDAAYLTQTGRFYLQVGFNEMFLLGQSAWAGGKYIPSENIKKNIDTSINYVNNVGYAIKNVETKKEEKVVANYGEELINVVKYLSNIAMESHISTKPLWLSRIPNFILVVNLIKKYNYRKENFVLNPVIGEYDIPQMQAQKLLTAPFYSKGNAMVYGTAGSGKENFITTLIFSSMIAYTPSEVNFYILDFGSESLRYFQNSPHVGDIIYSSDGEKLDNLYKMIQRELDSRKELFANYNGDYLTYCKRSGSSLPNIVIVINNFEGYQESYPNFEDTLNILTRDCTKYGIYFVLTVNTPNGVRFKLKQNFGQTFVLNQNSDDDYSTILGNVRKVFPAKNFGRGLIKEEAIFEFQTAFATEKDQIPEYIRQINDQYSAKYQVRAKKIPILPDKVSIEDIFVENAKPGEIAIGINKNDLTPAIYDFGKNTVNIITSQDSTLFGTIVNPLAQQFVNKNTYSNIIINAEDLAFDDEIKNSTNYVDTNFNGIYDSIVKYLSDAMEKYKANNMNKSIFNNVKKINCIIVGLTAFKSKLSEDRQNAFDKFFANISELNVINYIFIDTVDKLKKFNYDSWFKENVNTNNGIYLGNGIGDQILINVSKRIPEMKEDVPYNFGFIIKTGVPTYVKLIEIYK